MVAKLVLGLAAVLLIGFISWVGLSAWSDVWDHRIEVDKAEMSLTRKRLAPMVAELDLLPDPTGTMPRPASLSQGCVEDSGELLGQPEVSKGWDVPTGRTADAARELRSELLDAGWRPTLDGRFVRYESGWSITAAVTEIPAAKTDPRGPSAPGSVYVSAGVDGAEPCSQDGC